MQASSYRIEDIVPHRPPMLLVDRVVDFDEAEGSAVVEARARPEWTGSHSAIEYMAQAAAVLVGLSDRLRGESAARPGFLLGTRRLNLFAPSLVAGKMYLVSAKVAFSDGEAACFECEMRDGAEKVAAAALNAYRPMDPAAFLKEMIRR